MAKRASASSSSGQPSQPKRPCLAPTGQVRNGSEGNLVPGSCLTEEEDVQRVVESSGGVMGCEDQSTRIDCQWVDQLFSFDEAPDADLSEILAAVDATDPSKCGEEPGLAKSLSVKYCQSTGNALKDIVQLIHSMEKWFHSMEKRMHSMENSMENRMHSMENSIQELKQAMELAIIHSPNVGRSNAKSTAKNDARNLQLQVQTKLSLPLYTGKTLEGEGGAHIYVALIDKKTGGVVTSGAASSIKLDVVVLEGDFNKDDEGNWTQEEFENYVVKERDGKRPLLIGDLQVTLKKGVGQLGKLIFTDNSSWNKSKSFRIGLMVASGYCGNTRIQEAITDAFSVKEHRGESYMKHRLPASDDEVWRLEKIAKAGKSHQKLSEAGIHRVEDFLLQLFTDSQYLREILGKSITPKNWDILVDHAKTCKTNWKLYLSYSDGMRKHGAVFNTDGQLIGLIKDRVSFATDRLSAQDKEYGDAIVKKALANCHDVREFGGNHAVAYDFCPFLENPLYDGGSVRGISNGVVGWLKIKAVMRWGIFIRKIVMRRRGIIVQLDEPQIEVEA
ncbi:hypothetical protein NL676_007931 [Syzygium grande]|nr:hypothetical protein NL676_007931 [Syzygium grande]